MNRVTYLDRLGFAVTTDDVIMVFDYFTDPSHALHRILEQNPEKSVVFFVTHYCHEHFNKSIYELAQNHRRVYVMSNDVHPQNVPDTISVAGMSKGDVIEDLPGISSVRAFASTGKGVSFLVTAKNGETLFHAGNMSDDLEQPSIKKTDEADARFRSMVDRIAEQQPAIDIVFFPMDADAGIDFEQGARDFLAAVKVKDFFPMVIGGHAKEVCATTDYIPAGTAAHCIHTPGQSIEL